MNFDFKSARHWAQALIREAVGEGGVVVDATMGNGYDTAWLCELVGPSGRVYAFDIQPAALERTRARLAAQGLSSRAELFCAGHERLREFVHAPIDAALFNLGWLPGAETARKRFLLWKMGFSDAKITPSPPYTPPGTIEVRKGFASLFGFATVCFSWTENPSRKIFGYFSGTSRRKAGVSMSPASTSE